ncbi:MAG: addiction module protein [Deltaproteobacteria bacterium RIFCSPLOWO2_02_FULL_53_8]|nr:MAG: addiction module protein [Deltaproteobacteria bacterium RIFCSPLOWO2_02_FULL_53_8]
MTIATQTILKEALRLTPVERAELIEELYHSFDKKYDVRIDALWAQEAEARIEAHDAGHIKAETVETVFERINKR